LDKTRTGKKKGGGFRHVGKKKIGGKWAVTTKKGEISAATRERVEFWEFVEGGVKNPKRSNTAKGVGKKKESVWCVVLGSGVFC